MLSDTIKTEDLGNFPCATARVSVSPTATVSRIFDSLICSRAVGAVGAVAALWGVVTLKSSTCTTFQ
jgi:hypothetical protein